MHNTALLSGVFKTLQWILQWWAKSGCLDNIQTVIHASVHLQD